MSAMRSFVALCLPDQCRDDLVRVQSRLPYGRPVPSENLHLTLAFLEDVEDAAIEELQFTLSALNWDGVVLDFTGLDSFTERERGLVFAAVRPDPALCALQARVTSCTRQVGISLPRRRFRPHVTLTRGQRKAHGVARDRLGAMIGQSDEIRGGVADTIVLMQSTLRPTGAQHTALAHYRAAASGG